MNRMYQISKDFPWSASHVLNGLHDDHPCGRLHGHNYVARVTIEAATLDENGFVVDYGRLAPFKAYIDEVLDHRHLNDVTDENPTAEHLADMLTAVAGTCVHGQRDVTMYVTVAVSETPKTWARGLPLTVDPAAHQEDA